MSKNNKTEEVSVAKQNAPVPMGGLRSDMIIAMAVPMMESVAYMLDVPGASPKSKNIAKILRSAVAALREFQRNPNA